MNLLISRSYRFALLPACLAMLLCGCGTGRETVSGVVTLDGQPLASGKISLIPMDGTDGPRSGADIKNGEFEIEGKSGLLPGRYRVEIRAYRQSETNQAGPDEEPYYPPEQYLPAKYNDESEIIVEVKGGPLAPFELVSEEQSPE